MKKLTVTLLLLVSFFYTNAQDDKAISAIDKKHEIKLGAVKLLSGGIFEVAYENVIDSNQGLGVAVLFNLDSSSDYLENYSLTPFYRMYFQTKEDYGAKGFFVEGFTSFFGGDNDIIDFDSNNQDDKFFDISIGIGLGKKWINSAGFVFEIKVGAGRNLLGNAEIDALFKGDLYIGYRF